MDLVKIDAREYGLEETKAKQITDMFMPMLKAMEELESEYNSIIKLKVDELAISKAKELRLKYVKVRTGTAKIHKELKSFYLMGGKFVDGWKNVQLMASEGIEKKLMDVENHFKNIEIEKREKVKGERINLLKSLGMEVVPPSIGDMDDDIWGNYLCGVKQNYERIKEAEKKAEDDRIKKEKAEIEDRKRIKIENEKLKKEAEEREVKEKADRIKREKIEKIHLEKEAEEKKEREEKEKAVKEKIEKERERAHLELKKERDKKEKVEAELRKKEAKEARIEAERILKEETELQKGDSERMLDLVDDLVSLKKQYVFKSVANKKMFKNVCIFLDKVIVHITK